MKNFAAHCVICDSVAEFIKCSAPLIIEKDLSKNIALVKYYGLHTYCIKVKAPPEKDIYCFDLVFCIIKHSQN